MTIAIVDGLFSESELQALQLPPNFFKKVDQRAPDNIVLKLWPVEGERPSSSISLKVAASSEDHDPLAAAAKRIAQTCFSHISWEMCNARYFSYLPGERVIKHIDGADKLTSAVLYLTEDWQPACSGELEVDFEGQTVAVRPLRGRVVIVGPDVPHGSRAVASGTRTCIVFFYSRSPAG